MAQLALVAQLEPLHRARPYCYSGKRATDLRQFFVEH